MRSLRNVARAVAIAALFNAGCTLSDKPVNAGDDPTGESRDGDPLSVNSVNALVPAASFEGSTRSTGVVPQRKMTHDRATVAFYPAAYGWQRLQEFHRRASEPRFLATLAPVATLSPSRARRAHEIAINCALGHLAVITPVGRGLLLASLFDHVEAHGAAGLESLLLTGLVYAESSGDHALFARGVAAWKALPTIHPQDAAQVLDIKNLRVVTLSAADVASLAQARMTPGSIDATSVTNQIFGFLDAGVAADCEKNATAIGAVAGAVVGGVAGFIGGAVAGAGAGTIVFPGGGTLSGGAAGSYAGAVAGALAGGSGGKDIGDAVGPVICGWWSDDSTGAAGAGGAHASAAGDRAPGATAPGAEGGAPGRVSNQANPSGGTSEADPSGGTCNGGQTGDDTPAGGDDPGYPNPDDDLPNPDDACGFQMTSTTLMSSPHEASVVAKHAGAEGVLWLQHVPCFNELNGNLSITAERPTESRGVASYLADRTQRILVSPLPPISHIKFKGW